MRPVRLWSLAVATALMLSPPSYGAFIIDDGTAETSIGLVGGGTIIWFNQFNVAGGGTDVVTNIQIAFGSPGGTPSALNGLSFTAALWEDPNNDGNANDAVLVSSLTGVVSGASTNTFVLVNIPDAAVTDSFFIGALITHPSGAFPVAIDQTAPTFANRSFLNFGGNINNLSGSLTTEAVFFPGNFLIRADSQAMTTATPAPGGLVVLATGVVGLVGVRRRRAS